MGNQQSEIFIRSKQSMEEEESILIVDDDENTCKSLGLIFGKKGYQTERAATGREAIDKARKTPFILALLDIKLPDMEGVELIAPLKEMHPDMVTIMVTAYASVENTVRALNEGASGYVIKPLDMDAVLATVREVIEKQRLVREKRRAEEERIKLILKLKEALARVNTLSGLLPICAHCKNIRDDKGYWNKIEEYIRDHSEAEFSHSICPGCKEKLYS